ncbi:MAG: hypothetical protein K940chlam7_00087 [Chlamydiae bacterium]|nr:hypothetical protein [Chlamydiota bacterium]
MIELSPTTAMMLYLCFTLATLLGIWGYYHYRSRRQKVILIQQELYICEYCQCAYLAQIAKKVTQCPQCESFNKKN